ncbi:MAG: hypothetical protein RML47_06145 [Bacteroidota bacterium]|nr:hypothetical protein [Rhodothermia bacterium]MDW8285665.1 hypothetical protein [Bacteroidota bacterium]
MPAQTVHTVIAFAQSFSLWILVGLSALLAVLTLWNRLRIRRVLLYWSEGRLMGYPLAPTVYLGSVLAWGVWTLWEGRWDYLGELIPALLLGGFWFVSAYLLCQRLVTDHGLVPHVNAPHRAIPWEAIVDYFTTETPRYVCYTFLYSQTGWSSCSYRQRIRLRVPRTLLPAFRRIVQLKVDRRFQYPLERVYGREALNNE